jgi:hypothetical protein
MTKSDKRRKSRTPSFLGGTITYNRDLWSADCVVKNISESGAKLSARNLPVLPDRFDISIPQRNVKYRVQVRWRVRDQVGVAFEHDYSSLEPGAATKPAKRLSVVHPEDESCASPRLITDLAI